jgi:hypothetical protein
MAAGAAGVGWAGAATAAIAAARTECGLAATRGADGRGDGAADEEPAFLDPVPFAATATMAKTANNAIAADRTGCRGQGDVPGRGVVGWAGPRTALGCGATVLDAS